MLCAFSDLVNLLATYSKTSLFRTSAIQTLQLTEHLKYNSSTCKHEKFVGFAHSLVLHNTFLYGVQLTKPFTHLNNPWFQRVRITEVRLYILSSLLVAILVNCSKASTNKDKTISEFYFQKLSA